MKERPMLFSTPMVRAILNGSKTQTRRVVKPEPAASVTAIYRPFAHEPNNWQGYADNVGFIRWYGRCPYGQPGDRLWVRETHMDLGACVLYRADSNAEPERAAVAPRQRWAPSIHMPRHLSRITLEITAVRVERLQDISEADARAEGAMFHDGGQIGHSGWRHDYSDVHADARSSFARIWNNINGAGSWDKDPWVWVIDFRRVEGQR